MTPSELYYFSARCLTLGENPELADSIRTTFESEPEIIDWFIQFCSDQFILPVIYLKFETQGLLSVFPEEYAAHLKEIYTQNRNRNLAIIKQAEEISSILNKAGIVAVYLKGTAHLLDGLYSDIGERMIGDIDFLVSENDYLKTAELLLAAGYENQFKTYDDLTDLKHYPRLFRMDVPADVEIHRIPVNPQFSKIYNAESVFRQCKKATRFEPGFVPSDEHKMIHNFIHSQLSNKGYVQHICPLRDFYDWYLLSQKTDVEKVLKEVEFKKQARVYADMGRILFYCKKLEISIASSKFIQKHRYYFDHPKMHQCLIWWQKLYELFAIRYLAKIANAIYDKKSRVYIFRRVTSKEWYGLHFKSMKDYFKS